MAWIKSCVELLDFALALAVVLFVLVVLIDTGGDGDVVAGAAMLLLFGFSSTSILVPECDSALSWLSHPFNHGCSSNCLAVHLSSGNQQIIFFAKSIKSSLSLPLM